jgi:hypothetical protein
MEQIKGREPYLSVLSDGTIILTTHLLENDARNLRGHTYSFLYSSSDGGKSWSETEFDEDNTTVVTRNVIELPDKTLLLGVSSYNGGSSFIYKSFDKGKTWVNKSMIYYTGFPADYPFGFFEEGYFWRSMNGLIYVILRVDSKYFPLSNQNLPNNDQSDRMIIYSSKDGGITYTYSSDLGNYGEMYPNILKLQTGALLLTFTVRSITDPLGLRAVMGEESVDRFTFNLKNNVFVLDAKTPKGVPSGGGFGGTIQLDDGTLLSCYSYRDSDNLFNAEVIRWNVPIVR